MLKYYIQSNNGDYLIQPNDATKNGVVFMHEDANHRWTAYLDDAIDVDASPYLVNVLNIWLDGKHFKAAWNNVHTGNTSINVLGNKHIRYFRDAVSDLCHDDPLIRVREFNTISHQIKNKNSTFLGQHLNLSDISHDENHSLQNDITILRDFLSRAHTWHQLETICEVVPGSRRNYKVGVPGSKLTKAGVEVLPDD